MKKLFLALIALIVTGTALMAQDLITVAELNSKIGRAHV